MKCSLFWLGLVIFGFSLVAPSACEASKEKDASVAYVKASLPTQVFRCIQKFNLLRCLKYFVLLRLESRDYNMPETEKTTSEFLGNILKNEQSLPHEIPDNLLSLDEDELNRRLTEGFQRFFMNRPIMLRFIPNVLVKIVPSKSDDLEFSLKKFEEKDFTSRAKKDSDEDDDDEEDEPEEDSKEESVKPDIKDEDMKDGKPSDKGMRKKSTYLQFGIPLAIAPAMIFAGFLPMLIPILKLTTAFTTIVNFSALLGAVLYLARQQAIEKEVQSTVYFNPGYKDRDF